MRFALAFVVVTACGKASSDKVTRERCSKVADHMADIRMEHYAAHLDELWDDANREPDHAGLPDTVTKETLKAYVDSPEGKTWWMLQQGQARTRIEQGIDFCVQNASPKLVACLLAAKTQDEVNACDKAK